MRSEAKNYQSDKALSAPRKGLRQVDIQRALRAALAEGFELSEVVVTATGDLLLRKSLTDIAHQPDRSIDDEIRRHFSHEKAKSRAS
jgi:hypothetical protein